MRRRRRTADHHPAKLLTYRPEDWPDGCHPECRYWEAVEAWMAENPDEDLDVTNAPDGVWHPENI